MAASQPQKSPAQKAPRGRCLNLAPAPDGLFAPDSEIKTQVWDLFAPVWGQIVKFGSASMFDEVTYRQMLEDLKSRNLCVYMDNDHKTANLGWTVDEVESLAYYCSVLVVHEGKEFGRVNLAGHNCADAVPFDLAAHPEGMAGFRCRVTPYGKTKLPSYQALSIHFDPDGRDALDRPVGQVLICVSAVNGPHIPTAIPAGGQFARSGTMDPENKDGGEQLTPTLEELRKALGLPDGASADAIAGAALAVVKAAGVGAPEPDGDEAMADEEMAAGDGAVDDAMKKFEADAAEGDKDKLRGYARIVRTAVCRVYARRRVLGLLAKEMGAEKSSSKALVIAAAALKAKVPAEGTFAKLNERIAELETREKTREATSWEYSVKEILNRAGPTNAAIFSGKVGEKDLPKQGDGRISDKRGQELFELAKRANLGPQDVEKMLPDKAAQVFTQNGSPVGAGKGSSAGADPLGSDRVVGADQAAKIAEFRTQYQKDSGGKRITYQAAASILQRQFARGGAAAYDYQAAKGEADRLGDNYFMKAPR